MMTMIFSAFALALAAPAAGQASPQLQGTDHSQHKGMDHSQHGKSDHDCKKCCEDAKKTGAKMECGMDSKTEPKADVSGHAGHDH